MSGFLYNTVILSKMRIQTERLVLISCDQQLLRKLIYNTGEFGKLLDIKIPDKFSEFGLSPLQYSLDKLTDATEIGWWTYLPIHVEAGMLIGTCGYKGKPDKAGMVEIGYEVIEALRNKGYGREIASALIKNAFRYDDVTCVRAHTLAEENASVKILKSCNLKFISCFEDPDDGQLWRWEIQKSI
jgi:hypothetical protein